MQLPEISGKRMLRGLGVGIGLALISGLAIGYGLRPIVPGLSDADWLASIITTAVYLSLIAGHLAVFGGWSGVRRTFQFAPVSWTSIGKALLVWAGAMLLAVPCYLVISPVLGSLVDVVDALLRIGSLYGRLHDAGPGLMLVAVGQAALVTPFAEELVFRGSFLGWLVGKYTTRIAIAVSAVVFALYHPMPILWPAALLFGLAAGWIRVHTRSLTPFLVVHVLNNIALIVAAFLFRGWNV